MKRVIIRTTFAAINSILEGTVKGFDQELNTNIGEANLVFTGAKAYYRGGGWWAISGYSSSGEDVDKVLDKLGVDK